MEMEDEEDDEDEEEEEKKSVIQRACVCAIRVVEMVISAPANAISLVTKNFGGIMNLYNLYGSISSSLLCPGSLTP